MQYLALSIGPIVKTLKEARKTRELWAASYLLSTLMKHLMEQLDPADENGKHPNILIPSIPEEVQNATLYGAGIYPDRLFMEADGFTEKQVQGAIKRAFYALAKDCLPEGADDENHKAKIKKAAKFWEQFLRVVFVLKELPDIKAGKLSLELSLYLESLELEDTLLAEEPELNALYKLFDVNNIYKVPLSDALKGDNRGVYDPTLSGTAYVPPIYEIAAMELHQVDSMKLQTIIGEMKQGDLSEEFYNKIEKDKDKDSKLAKALQPRHKYYCIVRADGDSIGAAIKTLGDRQAYIDFSELLANFGKDAAEKIDKYGGKPIYIGGDDLLFLAPLHNGNETIFELIKTIDDIFPVEQLATGDANKKASLSYGLNIAYYKYPLFEAIDDSFDIMYKAKGHKTKAGAKKNAVSFHFTKHSGSFFDATFSKDYLALINKATKAFNQQDKQQRRGLVSSLIFKIKILEQLLISLVKKTEADKVKDRLGYFFDKYFEEWKDNEIFKAQKQSAKELLHGAYEEVGEGGFLDLYFATMRLIDFINEPNQHTIHDTENQLATTG